MNTVLTILLLIIIGGIAWKASHDKKTEQHHVTKSSPQKSYHPLYLLRLEEVKRRAEARGDIATIEACNNKTYTGPFPVMKPDRTFVAEDSAVVDYNIAGINFRRGVNRYVGELMGYIEAKPKNKYDPNAIAIRAFDGQHLGYIPADYTDDVRNLTRSAWPYPVWCEIEEDYDDDERRKYYRGTVYLEIPPAKDSKCFPTKSSTIYQSNY